jgi:hypothetical protein
LLKISIEGQILHNRRLALSLLQSFFLLHGPLRVTVKVKVITSKLMKLYAFIDSLPKMVEIPFFLGLFG